MGDTEFAPTLDDLMAMSEAERSYWLERAATIVEPYYRTRESAEAEYVASEFAAGAEE